MRYCIRFFLFIVLAYTGSSIATLYKGKSFFLPKSQSLNFARHMVGRSRDLLAIHCTIDPDLYAIPFYGQSFRPQVLADYFFGTDSVSVQGSTQITNTSGNDLLADYFGLSTDYEGSLCVRPFVSNGGIDFGAHAFYKRWYFTFHAPLVWAHTLFEIQETIDQKGEETLYPAGYMANDAIIAPATSFKRALEGVTWGNVTTPLQFGKFDPCGRTVRGIADVRLYTGFRLYQSCNGYVGLDMRLAAPTGNTPDMEFLFEPIVGNGHHWEFGFGMLAGSIIWQENEYHWFGWNAQLSVTHLFGDCQLRSFDLRSFDECNFSGSRPLSRYILAKEFVEQTYLGNTEPLINATTLPVDVSILIQVNFAAMLSWWHYGWEFDLGYELWARSRESFGNCTSFENARHGLKGIVNVTNGAGSFVDNTQSTATIQGNPLIDQAFVIDVPSPILISGQQLSPSSARAGSSFTQKFFTHVAKHWEQCMGAPTLGLGAEVEFDGSTQGYLDLQEDRNSVNQWGVWIKGGWYF